MEDIERCRNIKNLDIGKIAETRYVTLVGMEIDFLELDSKQHSKRNRNAIKRTRDRARMCVCVCFGIEGQ